MSSELSLLVAVERCPLCGRAGKQLTCRKCILIGNFSSSKSQPSDVHSSFAYKKKRLLVACSVKDATLKKVEACYGNASSKEQKQSQIVQLIDKIKTLKIALETLKKQCLHDKEFLQDVKKSNNTKKLMIRRLEEKIKRFQNSHSLKEKKFKHQQNIEKLSHKQTLLKNARENCIKDLITDIFPLHVTKRCDLQQEVTTTSECSQETDSHSDLVYESTLTTEMELAEATQTVHVDGRWVSQAVGENITIVDIAIPSSTDFLKYCEWLKSYRNEPKATEGHTSLHNNTIMSVPASLAYSSQLVDVASLLLGVNLPNRISHITFSLLQSSRQRVFGTYIKLIENVMYLCLSQHVPVEELQPKDIANNLCLCFSEKNEDIGHCGSFTLYEYMLPECPFECDLSGEELDFDTDSNCDDSVSKEKEDWDELLDLHESQAYSPLMSPTPSQSMVSSSTAGGLVSSAAASVASALWSWK